MQRWRGLAVVACVVLGMSGAARADWRDDLHAETYPSRQECNGPMNPLLVYCFEAKSWRFDMKDAHARGDYRAAINITKPEAEQGNAQAQSSLGIMYTNGQGVAQDYKTAVEWYTQAAKQGHDVAQNNLGVMYEHGQGVAQDYVKAHMWFNIAAIDGTVQKAAKNRDAIAKKMTPIQIARAQELATKCVAQRFRNCGS